MAYDWEGGRALRMKQFKRFAVCFFVPFSVVLLLLAFF